MQHAEIKDNYPLWRSQATNSQEYFKNPTSNETLHTRRNLERFPVFPVSPGSERQPAHRITSASLQSFPPQGPENHLQITSISRKHGIFILIESIIHLWDKSNYLWHLPRNRTQLQQFDNYHPTPTTSKINSPGISHQNTFEQHFTTHQHSTFTMLSYTISKMSPLSGSVELSLQRTK